MRKVDKTVLVKLLEFINEQEKILGPTDKKIKLVMMARKIDWYETSQEQYKKKGNSGTTFSRNF